MEERVEQRALSTGMWLTVVSKAAVEPMMTQTSDVVQAQLVMKRGLVHFGVDSLRTKGKGRMWPRRRHGRTDVQWSTHGGACMEWDLRPGDAWGKAGRAYLRVRSSPPRMPTIMRARPCSAKKS